MLRRNASHATRIYNTISKLLHRAMSAMHAHRRLSRQERHHHWRRRRRIKPPTKSATEVDFTTMDPWFYHREKATTRNTVAVSETSVAHRSRRRRQPWFQSKETATTMLTKNSNQQCSTTSERANFHVRCQCQQQQHRTVSPSQRRRRQPQCPTENNITALPVQVCPNGDSASARRVAVAGARVATSMPAPAHGRHRPGPPDRVAAIVRGLKAAFVACSSSSRCSGPGRGLWPAAQGGQTSSLHDLGQSRAVAQMKWRQFNNSSSKPSVLPKDC